MSASDTTYPDADRRNVIPLIPPTTARLLDVGCWRGAFGQELKRRNPNLFVAGVEANPAAAAVAATRLDKVVAGRFPEDLSQERPFDCVVFNDVLEHLVDPWEALRLTRSLLADSGTVVAVIPNIRHVRAVMPLLFRGRWDYADTGLLDRTHLRFFTRATMIELFETAGYTVNSITPQDLSDVGLRGVGMRLLLAPFGREHSEGLRARHYALVASPDRPTDRVGDADDVTNITRVSPRLSGHGERLNIAGPYL
ncbi:MAG: class I SAM-dependent methyltransferase [Actinomycetota bacterium]|nr:class I SAM-dependent methyltransferase [Actinomycetota bacterium]